MERLTVAAERLPERGEMAKLIDAEPIKKFIVDGLNNPNPKEAFGHDAIEILAEIEYAPAVDAVYGQWIPVTERLPEEHDSMFAKWYDTPLWNDGMFRTTSGEVLVCIEYGEGSRLVSTARTNSGEWNISSIFSGKVTYWMPMPQPPEEEE